MQCPSVILYSADMSCPGPLPSSDLFNHVCDFCLFSFPDLCFSDGSQYVMFNILLSIFVCAAASLFFGWVVRSSFHAVCHCWKYA